MSNTRDSNHTASLREDDVDPQLSAWYRQTRDVEPPAHVDVQVLTAAHQAVLRRGRRSIRRWMLPLATAAVLVLGVGLVQLVQHESPSLLQPAPSVSTTGLDHTAPAADNSEPRRKVIDTDVARQPAGLAAPMREPAATSPAPAAAVPEAPASNPVKGDLYPGKDSALNRQETLKQETPQARAGTEEPPLAPAQWLAKIAELQRQHRTAEADAELRKFRRQYPDYPLDVPVTLPPRP